jgi:hypothetical protein
MNGFKSTLNRGFSMEFANSFLISVQFGGGCYCSNRDNEFMSEKNQDVTFSHDAEIAVFNPEGSMVLIGENDHVIGWVTPNEVAKVISIVSLASTEEEIKEKIKALNLK